MNWNSFFQKPEAPLVKTPNDLDENLNEHRLSESEAEILFVYLLGQALNSELTTLYAGRNQPKLDAFRRSLNSAFESGAFVVSANPDEQQRNGNDENPLHPYNRRIKALCGVDASIKIGDAARPAKLSNAAALRVGVRAALDRWAL